MNTSIAYLDAETRAPSDCGEPLDIEVSSAGLGWKGLVVEQGWSPFFHPTSVVTPNFYFALARDAPLQGRVLRDGEELELEMEPGEIWLNPPWSPFTHRIDVPCYFTILTVEPARLVAAYDGSLDVGDAEFLNDFNVDDPFLAKLVELFLAEAAAGHPDDTPLFAHLLGAFANYFFDRYSGTAAGDASAATPVDDGTALPDGAVEAVEAYVRAHMDQSIRVEHLAAHVGMGRFWFLKSFRRATGITPYQYILGMKVERARALLRGGDLPLARLALSLGFADQSHFSRVFKRHVGVSPGLYRDQQAVE